jgi:two-component system, OmpR family, sensor histidine kinase MprB
VSLRVRLGLAAGVAVAVAVIAVTVSSYAGTSSELHGQIDSALRSQAARAVHFAQTQDGTPPPGQGAGPGFAGRGGRLAFEHRRRPPFGGAEGVLEQLSPRGSLLASDAQDRIPVDARMRALARRGAGHYFADTRVRGVALRLYVVGAGSAGAFIVALPLTAVDHALSHQLVLLIIIAAAGIALAALLGLLVARAALAPIARFTRQTEAIATSPERLETDRVEVHGGDELARLARTFNETLDALQRSIEAQRNLVADASHELRTPIATIRANLQLMRDEEQLPPGEREALRRDVIEELDELTALVSDVVELARGSKPRAAPADVRLDEIVVAALERTRRRAPSLTVTSELEPTLVRGEGDRIARAVANLLDNAMKWSPESGAIEVRLRDGTLTVRDHGPGFAEEDLPFVFDRFHRARAARSMPGSGLGLAIVRQAAEAHGGAAGAANAPGGGALMTIDFGPAQELVGDLLADDTWPQSPAGWRAT